MDEVNKQTDAGWGFHFNRCPSGVVDDPPTWANKGQRGKWARPGLVLWDHASQTIANLTATQTLRILNGLEENDEWQRGETTIGEPTTRIWLDEPAHKPEQVLIHQIYLTPTRVQMLLETLRR